MGSGSNAVREGLAQLLAGSICSVWHQSHHRLFTTICSSTIHVCIETYTGVGRVKQQHMMVAEAATSIGYAESPLAT